MHDYVEEATRNLTVDELSKFARLFQKVKKSEKVAYVVWLFGGAFGFHRIYTGHYGTAIGLMVVTIMTFGIGAIAGWYDVVNVKRLVEESNKELTLQIVKEVKQKNGVWV